MNLDWRSVVGDRPLFFAIALVVAASMLWGGAGAGGMMLIELLSLPAVAILVWRLGRDGLRFSGPERFPKLILAFGVLIVLAQLIPLPPVLWSILPGRGEIAAVFTAAGEPLPWLPLSLDRDATVRSLLSALPHICVFLGVLGLNWTDRRRLSVVIAAFGFVSLLVGIAEGAANAGNANGLLTNRNHFAALLYCLLPLATAFAVPFIRDRKKDRVVPLTVFGVVVAVLLLGLGVAQSRAGLGLAVITGVFSYRIAQDQGRGRRGDGSFFLAAGVVIGILLISEFALGGILNRFDADLTQDLRIPFFVNTFKAVADFFPVGSGLGTFVPVYSLLETPETVMRVFANHAHNDWLELLLELGLPGFIWMALGLFWVVLASAEAWQDRTGRSEIAFARAGSVVICLLLVHSAVDYPLRAPAVMVVFAYAAALLAAGRPRASQSLGLAGPAQQAPALGGSSQPRLR